MNQTIQCPFCHHEFSDEPVEEILNPTANIVRRLSERSSWQEIADGIAEGRANRLFSIGDSIEFKLKDGRDVSVKVADVNLYGNDEVIFVFGEAVGEHQMNIRNTNHGGYPNCEMDTWLNKEFIELLPDDLKEVITSRRIIQKIDGAKYTGESKLWLPSIVEVGGEEYRECDCEDDVKQFAIFNDVKERCKVLDNHLRYWWERSPSVSNSTNFMGVYFNGYPGTYYSASNTSAVVPCFSIKANKDGSCM